MSTLIGNRTTQLLLALLAAQIALIVGLGWRGGELRSVTPDTLLVAADLDAADRIDITDADGARVTLAKSGDAEWTLPAFHGVAVAPMKLSAALGKLRDARRGLPVATTAGALQRFKVADQNFERKLTFKRGDVELVTVLLGSAPGLRKIHARTAADSAVYSVTAASYDWSATGEDWFDRGLLGVKTAELSAVTLRRPEQADLTLTRTVKDGKTQWRATGLGADAALNPKQADALARNLENLRIDAIRTDADAAFERAAPVLTLIIDTADGARDYQLRKLDGDDAEYLLKAGHVAWIAELKSWNAEPLIDSADRQTLVVSADQAAAPSAAADP